jgi:hypothetical protein
MEGFQLRVREFLRWKWMRAASFAMLAVVLSFGVTCPVSAADDWDVWDGTKAVRWFALDQYDSGFEYNDVITVSTGAQLAYIADLVNSSAIEETSKRLIGRTLLLDRNLDLSVHEWTPIGTPKLSAQTNFIPVENTSLMFLGTFDGQGHTIKYKIKEQDSGVIVYSTSRRGAALFGGIGLSGAVKNLSVEADLSSPKLLTGGIAVINQGIISGCAVSGNISKTYLHSAGTIGGVAAINADGLVDNCSVSAKVEVDRSPAGGVVGRNVLSGGSVVRGCSLTADGSVTGYGLDNGRSGYTILGGIVGWNERTGIIEGSSVYGAVRAVRNQTDGAIDGAVTGGIAAANDGGTVENCLFDGVLSGQTLGGIAGRVLDGGMNLSTGHFYIRGCTANVRIGDALSETSAVRIGGIAGYSASVGAIFHIENCFASGDLRIVYDGSSAVYIGGIGGNHAGSIANAVASCDISSASTGTQYLGGIAGDLTGNAINNVSLGRISAANVDNSNIYAGGIYGSSAYTSQVKNNVSLCEIAVPASATAGGLFGAVSGNLQDNLWLSKPGFNEGLKFAGDASETEDEANNLKRVTDEANFPATAAILHPALAVLRKAPAEFEVKVYPEGASASASVAGMWSKDGDSISFSPALPDGRRVTVKPIAVGPATVTYSLSDNLYGDALKPVLTSSVYVESLPETIDISGITGVSAPAAGGIPSTADIDETEQFTGTVSWLGEPGVFGYETAYTAVITLAAKPGFTFDGVPENFFTVEGAESASNEAGGSTVTAAFPATGPVPDDTPPALAGVTVSGGATYGVPSSGVLTVAFSEAMNGGAPGTVTLTPAGGSSAIAEFAGWMSADRAAYNYSGLASGTAYTVGVSGFEDAAGNLMAPASAALSFTTAAAEIAPLPPDIYPGSFTDPGVTVQVNAETLVAVGGALPDDFGELGDLSDFLNLSPSSGLVTADPGAMGAEIEMDGELGEAADTDEEMLALPAFRAQVEEEGMTALVTFKVNLGQFSGRKLRDLAVIKILNSGSVRKLPKAGALAEISSGQYVWTDGEGVKVPGGTEIGATDEYWLHAAIADQSEYDWNAAPMLITDPLAVVPLDLSGAYGGHLVRAEDAGYIKDNWKTNATVYRDGAVTVEIEIPLTGALIPEDVFAETRGFIEGSTGFYIADASGAVVADYLSGLPGSSGSPGAAFPKPYTLRFYGTCESAEAYRSAVIESIGYWMPGEEEAYAQVFAGGVSVPEGTDAREAESEDENAPSGPGNSGSSGGCAAGAAGLAAIVLAMVTRVAANHRARG